MVSRAGFENGVTPTPYGPLTLALPIRSAVLCLRGRLATVGRRVWCVTTSATRPATIAGLAFEGTRSFVTVGLLCLAT